MVVTVTDVVIVRNISGYGGACRLCHGLYLMLQLLLHILGQVAIVKWPIIDYIIWINLG